LHEIALTGLSGERILTMNNRAEDERVAKAHLLNVLRILLLPFGLFLSATAFAAPPPARETIDENSVDLFRGTFAADDTIMTIGQDQGMVLKNHWRGSGWTSNMRPLIYKSGTTFTVTIDGNTDRFIQSGSTFTPTEGRGTSLTSSSGSYTYRARDGTVVSFAAYPANSSNYKPYGEALASSLVRPNGQRLDFTYQAAVVCDYYNGDFCAGGFKQIRRLASIKGAYGYLINFSYDSDDPETDGLIPWTTIADMKMVNLGHDYCASTIANCATTQNWPTVSNPNAAQMVYIQTGGDITGVRRPGSTTNDITIAYSAGKVSSVSDRSGTTNYSYSDAGGERTVNVTNAVGATTVYKFNIALERMTSVTDPLGNTTTYAYDSFGRLTNTTYPEGNQLVLTYDARGNVLSRRKIAKPGSGLADLLATANYPASCTNVATCNQPTSTVDEKGNVTDYSYDATHGGLLTITAPAPTAGAARPQIRYGYSTLQAQIKNSSNAIVGSGQNVVLLTSISQCKDGASCTGSANELVETITYGSTGVANNLLPTVYTKRSGDNAIMQTTTMAYDPIGNLLSVNGPLVGNADTSYFRYDSLRRKVGEIGADPDDGGPRPRVAMRTTYNAAHLRSRVERGTVNGIDDTAWAAFAPAETVDVAYDSDSRPTKTSLSSGGTILSVSQTSYDAEGRVDCTAQRMNPATFASLPASACTLATTGANGPDRISKTSYDSANRVIKVESGIGTAELSNEVVASYTANGAVASVTDGEGNRTENVYNGHDRLVKNTVSGIDCGGQCLQPGGL
jgi:YD repeat-containing protein